MDKITIGLCFEPLDSLFFRDGKPFGAADKAQSRPLPMPQTVAGAVRTWMLRKAGCDLAKLGDEIKAVKQFTDALPDGLKPIADVKFRGPWLCRDHQPLVPVPATLVSIEGESELQRLDPLNSMTLPGWNPPAEGMLPLWRKDINPAKRVEGYLSLAGLKKFLEGGVPGEEDIYTSDKLFEFDRRTGIGVDPDKLSAADSEIYSVNLLALKKNVSLYLEIIDVPNSVTNWLPKADDTLPLGGEGRRVITSTMTPVQWPSAAGGQGAMLVLLTPGLFGGWKPSSLNGNLVSADVPGYEAVSGWDLAKGGPKPNRFAVNAGSVYFVDKWDKASVGSLCSGEDAAQGYGIYVQGRFNYV